MIVDALQRVAKILADSVYSSGTLLFATTASGVGTVGIGLVPPAVTQFILFSFIFLFFCFPSEIAI